MPESPDRHAPSDLCRLAGRRSVSLTDPEHGHTVQALVFDSLQELKRAVIASGSHWFDPSAMKFFGTILHALIDGCVFVTGESPDPSTPYRYTLRYVATETDKAGRLIVGDLGSFCGYDTEQAATEAAHTVLGH